MSLPSRWQAATARLRSLKPSLARRLRPSHIEAALALGVFLPTFVDLVRSARFFGRINALLHFDDAYVGAVAARMVGGQFLPYVDAAGQRGPLFYWLAAAAQAWGGWTEWLGLRRLAVAGFVLGACAVFAAGVAARRALAGAFGALFFVAVCICSLELVTVFGMVSEPFANLFTVAALAFTAHALQPDRRPTARSALLAAAGALSACAALTKQTYLLAIAPYLAWAAAFAVSAPPGQRRERFVSIAAMLGGWALPLVAVVLVFAAAGELSTFYYWCFVYNRDVYMEPYGGAQAVAEISNWVKGHQEIAIGAGVLTTAAVVRAAWPLRGRWRDLPGAYARGGFAATIALQLIISLIATISPLRFWSQYYLPPVPWLALFVGLVLADAIEPGISLRPLRLGARVTFVGGLVLAIGLGGVSLRGIDQGLRQVRRERKQGQWADARPERVCEAVEEFSRPNDPIFVWGFDGDIYMTCQRRPVSRFVYTTLVAGIVPPFWRDLRPQRTARGAVETLIAELAREHPPIILDTDNRMRGISLRKVESVAGYVRARYRVKKEVTANDGRTFKVWLRNDLYDAATPKPDGAEAPHNN